MVDAAMQRKLRDLWQKTAATSERQFEPSGEEQLEWHVILPQGQLGPLPLSALIQKMVGGEMPPRSYVWRDGMGDWKRADQVPEVARWLPASRPTAPRRRSAPAARTSIPPGGRTVAGPAVAAARSQSTEIAEQFFEGAECRDGCDSAPQTTRDALANVRSSPELAASKPGELTKFFITQAHVSSGRSPWAVVAFGLGAAVLLVGGLLGLAQLGVPVPLVPQEPGTHPKIFNGSQGDSRLRDLLVGRPKAPAQAGGSAAGPGRQAGGGQADQGSGLAQGPLAKRAEQHVDQLGKNDKDQLSRLYASQDLGALKLKPTQNAALFRCLIGPMPR